MYNSFMNRHFKILLINCFLFFLLFQIFEFFEYKTHYLIEYQNGWNMEKNSFFNNLLIFPLHNFDNALKNALKRTPVGNRIIFRTDSIDVKNTKPSVILFGCSFTFGAGLNDDETFSYKLSKYTRRNVYNRGIAGYGVQHMLYMLDNADKFRNISDFYNISTYAASQPMYIIYTFIGDHIYRLYKANDYFDIYLMFYKYDKNKKLKKYSEKDLWWWHSYILRSIYMRKIDKYVLNILNKKNNFLLEHFILSNQKIKEIYPNSKFVIFVYDGDNYIKLIQKELEQSGIIVIYLSELTDIDFSQDEYKINDKMHPNAKAWNTIVPLLVKKLNL